MGSGIGRKAVLGGAVLGWTTVHEVQSYLIGGIHCAFNGIESVLDTDLSLDQRIKLDIDQLASFGKFCR